MTCPLCLNSNPKSFFSDSLHKSYHRCLECDLIWLDPQNLPTPQTELKKYKEHNNSLENKGYVAMFEDFLDFIALKTLKPKRLLDFGSGPEPVLSQILKQKGYTCHIFDPIFAPTTQNLHQNYDLITCTEVAEHFHHPRKSFEHLVSLLDQKGYLAIMTQFHPQNEADFLNWWYIRDPTHVSFYSLKTFHYLATLLKLKIIKHDEKNRLLLQKCAYI